MYKMIRCGNGYEAIIAVSPPEADLRTKDAKFFRYLTWEHGGFKPNIFNEVPLDIALMYFGDMADSMAGFEQPPEQVFESLEEMAAFINEKKTNVNLYLAISGSSRADVLKRLKALMDNLFSCDPHFLSDDNAFHELRDSDTGKLIHQIDYQWSGGKYPAMLADLFDGDSKSAE